jgi:hypothetical protein
MKSLIDIIEPIELLEKSGTNLIITINKLFKIYGSLNTDGPEFKSIVFCTRDISKKTEYVIDLSKISSDNFAYYIFSKSSIFSTNKYSAFKYDVFLSSIRPNLKKYGIVSQNMDILGTLINMRCIDKKTIGIFLAAITSENFLSKCITNTRGTKMPIIT